MILSPALFPIHGWPHLLSPIVKTFPGFRRRGDEPRYCSKIPTDVQSSQIKRHILYPNLVMGLCVYTTMCIGSGDIMTVGQERRGQVIFVFIKF